MANRYSAAAALQDEARDGRYHDEVMPPGRDESQPKRVIPSRRDGSSEASAPKGQSQDKDPGLEFVKKFLIGQKVTGENGRKYIPSGSFNADAQAIQINRNLAEQLGVEQKTPLPLNDKGAGFFTTRFPGQTYQQHLEQVAQSGNFVSPADVEARYMKAYGVEEPTPEFKQQVLDDSRGRSRFVGSIQGVGATAGLEAVRNAGTILKGGDQPQIDALLQVMQVQKQDISAAMGAAAGDGYEAELKAMLQAGDVKGVVSKLQITDEQLKTVLPSNVDSQRSFEMPYLKDMPVWGHVAGIAGASAGATALAYHLLAQGQQQRSSADYNAMAQAMAAY
jgi:hypothetical protein